MGHGDKNFLSGLPHDVQLMGIIDMCRDSSGHVNMADVEAMAAATGHHTFEDFGLLDAFAASNNEQADRDDTSSDDAW